MPGYAFNELSSESSRKTNKNNKTLGRRQKEIVHEKKKGKKNTHQPFFIPNMKNQLFEGRRIIILSAQK